MRLRASAYLCFSHPQSFCLTQNFFKMKNTEKPQDLNGSKAGKVPAIKEIKLETTEQVLESFARWNELSILDNEQRIELFDKMLEVPVTSNLLESIAQFSQDEDLYSLVETLENLDQANRMDDKDTVQIILDDIGRNGTLSKLKIFILNLARDTAHPGNSEIVEFFGYLGDPLDEVS